MKSKYIFSQVIMIAALVATLWPQAVLADHKLPPEVHKYQSEVKYALEKGVHCHISVARQWFRKAIVFGDRANYDINVNQMVPQASDISFDILPSDTQEGKYQVTYHEDHTTFKSPFYFNFVIHAQTNEVTPSLNDYFSAIQQYEEKTKDENKKQTVDEKIDGLDLNFKYYHSYVRNPEYAREYREVWHNEFKLGRKNEIKIAGGDTPTDNYTLSNSSKIQDLGGMDLRGERWWANVLELAGHLATPVVEAIFRISVSVEQESDCRML